MGMQSKFLIAIGIIVSSSSPAAAGDSVSLVPFGNTIRFAPFAPAVVAPDHPFAGRIRIDPIVGMPGRIGSFLNTFVRAKELNEALDATIGLTGMRAKAPTSAPFHLTVTWLTFESPFKISFSSRAKATLRYELRRTGSEELIFRRDVVTSAESSGGDASTRQRGTVRATLAANLAGAIWCMEQSPLGKAPTNCTSNPVGRFAAPITLTAPVYR